MTIRRVSDVRRRDESGDPGYAQSFSIPAPRLNPRYTFNSFIVGTSNKFAHAASLAVAEPRPGLQPALPVRRGGAGQDAPAARHRARRARASGLRVLYVSSETFTNEMIKAIRYRTTEEFRAKYRSADVLLVDDIQFIAGKDSPRRSSSTPSTAIHESSEQIVMSSDRPPKAIVSLEERLRSRFEWGLIADIQPPDLETRMAILRAKADAEPARWCPTT